MAGSIDSILRQFAAMGMPPIAAADLHFNAGRICRYGPKKKAWYKLFEHQARNGKYYYAGVFGFKGDGPWKLESDWSDMDPAERDKWHREREAAEKREAEKRAERAKFAANRAKMQWEAGSKQGVSIYLARKQVDPEGVRFAADGTLLIPLLRYDEPRGRLIGLQKITPDGTKLFNRGMAQDGAACRLGPAPKDGDTLVIVEGYATGASIRMALSRSHVVYVALNAGNLLAVAKILRARFPASPIIFAADDDYLPTASGDDNHTGRIKAEAAAAAVGNARVVLPVFTTPRRATEADESLPKLTDFNDLHLAEGLDVVRAQILAAMEPAALPAPIAGQVHEALTIDAMLQRFALVVGKTDVWDSHGRSVFKSRAFAVFVGKALAQEWLDHPQRRTIAADQLPRLSRGRDAQAGAGGHKVQTLLSRYTLLYGTATVWDHIVRRVISLDAVRAAHGNDLVKLWQEHPDRHMIDAECLVFDPTQRCDPSTHINMYSGLPLVPLHDDTKCDAILDLASHLCNDDARAFHWLMCWLALPLQRPGTKMHTAVLMYGERQGTGKSMFWQFVIQPIYGEYATTAGQHQLESSFTDWKSRRLFVLFEEVLSRSDRYNHIGTLKHMITGRTHRINPKNLPEREEENYLNSVFLSNEPQPIPLELDDRRFLVLESSRKLMESLRLAVEAEINSDGIRAFMGFLLRYDCTIHTDAGPRTFTKHDHPPVTDAKRKIIEFGLPGWHIFWRSWKSGELDVPYCSCLTEDLYRAYRRWCDRSGERSLTATKFSTLLAGRERKSIERVERGQGVIQRTCFVVDEPHGGIAHRDGKTKPAWLAVELLKFADALRGRDDD